MCATSLTGTAYPIGAPELNPFSVRFACCPNFCIVLCRPLIVFFSIDHCISVLFALRLLTISFGSFKIFLAMVIYLH